MSSQRSTAHLLVSFRKKRKTHTNANTGSIAVAAAAVATANHMVYCIACCRAECISKCICIHEQKTQSSVLFAWCDTQYGTD